MCTIDGSINAKVLPEPVSATLMQSLPDRATGHACACTGVGAACVCVRERERECVCVCV